MVVGGVRKVWADLKCILHLCGNIFGEVYCTNAIHGLSSEGFSWENSIVLFFFVALIFCNYAGNAQTNRRGNGFCFDKLEIVRYDTVSDTFLYENYVSAYIAGDEIRKSGGFIRVAADIKGSYLKGYYVLDRNRLYRMHRNNSSVHYDSVSFNRFSSYHINSGISDGTFNGKTTINPYKGVYYKKYYLSMEVLYVGEIDQLSPFNFSQRHLKDAVPHEKLPTFLITNILNFKEIKP